MSGLDRATAEVSFENRKSTFDPVTVYLLCIADAIVRVYSFRLLGVALTDLEILNKSLFAALPSDSCYSAIGPN